MICHVSLVAVTEGCLFSLWEWVFWRRSSLTANEHKVYEYSGGTMPAWPSRQVWTLRSTKQSIKHQMRHVEAGVNKLITRNCPSNRASIIVRRLSQLLYLKKPLLMFSINFNQLKQNGKNISTEFHEINVLLWLCGSTQRSLRFQVVILCRYYVIMFFLLGWGWAATHGYYLTQQLSENSEVPMHLLTSQSDATWRVLSEKHCIGPLKPDVVSSYFIWPILRF